MYHLLKKHINIYVEASIVGAPKTNLSDIKTLKSYLRRRLPLAKWCALLVTDPQKILIIADSHQALRNQTSEQVSHKKTQWVPLNISSSGGHLIKIILKILEMFYKF